MFFKQGKIIITLFMLLAFTGQALAYNAEPCTMHEPAPQRSAELSMPDGQAMSMQSGHEQHLASHSHETMAPDDCQNTCCCPMGSCVSAALTSETSTIGELFINSAKISLGNNLLLSRYPASLYRPPILS
ncbi:hypothetical protein [Thalassomonas sp. RHCl1]|uniref:hypothetical protein n=1 Tax=Thalassomonas sp. RHCl1 TaxID=2995320 RepID=UPI00248C10EE|nr:hypothetical protein [Thalassomonas sp. RHCl1]